jgi:hypothetical protein
MAHYPDLSSYGADSLITIGWLEMEHVCRFSGPSVAPVKDYKINSHGSGVLYVPSGTQLYVSPNNVAHYIDAHGYCPPEEFQRAVLECPDMRSIGYMRALLATPARKWVEGQRAVGK